MTVPLSGIVTGAFTKSLVSSTGTTGAGNQYGSAVLNFDASDSSPVYKNGAKVRPDSLGVSFVIKY